MSRTRLHIAFVGVVLATAAMIFMAGPDAVLSLAVVFVGFALLYVSGLSAAASSPREGGRPEKPRSARGRAEPEAPTPSAPNRLHEPPGRAEPAAGPESGRRPAPGASEGQAPRSASRSREESRWLDEQLSGDVDDIAFLPPYASDSVEGADTGADDGEEPYPWPPPGFPDAEPQPGEEAAEAVESYRNVPIPRHFALGTVAIIRDLMKPAQVAQVLLEQRRRPKQQFGTLAVEMGFLTPGHLRELLVAQQEGLFTDEEIQSARSRLRAFRAAEAPSS